MSIPVEELEVIISANADMFRKELLDVKKQLGGLNKTTQALSGGIGGAKGIAGAMFVANVASRALVAGLRVASRAISKMGAEVFEGGSQLSRMKVATNTLANNLGITTGELNKLRTSLSEANTYGLKAEQVISSLARTGLMDMAKSLEAVDARTGDTVEGISALVLEMKDLGAVAGKSSSQAIQDITDFITRGRTEAVEGMIAIGNLGTEYREYAKTLGKTRTQLTAQEEAEARLQLVRREATKAFGAYADAYTTSGKMIDSITDAWTSSLQELGGFLEPIFAAASSAVLKFVQGVRNFLISNESIFKNWAVNVAAYIIYVVRGIGRMLQRIPLLGGFMKDLANFSFPKVSTSANNTTKSIGGVGSAMSDAADEAKNLKKELSGLAAFDDLNVLDQKDDGNGGTTGFNTGGIDIGGGGLAAFGDVSSMINEINEKVENLENTFGGFEITLGKVFNPFTNAWKNNVKPAFKELDALLFGAQGEGADFAEVLGFIGAVGATSFELVAYAINGVIATLQSVWWRITSLIELVKVAGSSISIIFSGVADQVKREWEYTMTFLKNSLKIGLAGIWSILTGDLNGFLTAWKNAFKNMGGYVTSMISSLSYTIGKMLMGIGSNFTVFLKNILNSMPGWMKGMFNSVVVYVNRWLGSLGRIEIPKWVPGYGGRNFSIPKIPYLAQGGVIENPTIAMIGEQGREAVMPLDKNTGWIDELAGKLGDQAGQINLVVNVGEDKIFEKTIDYINDKSQRSGGMVLNI